MGVTMPIRRHEAGTGEEKNKIKIRRTAGTIEVASILRNQAFDCYLRFVSFARKLLCYSILQVHMSKKKEKKGSGYVLNVKVAPRILTRTLRSLGHSNLIKSSVAPIPITPTPQEKKNINSHQMGPTQKGFKKKPLTLFPNIKRIRPKRLRPTPPLARRHTRHEEARKARADLPHEHGRLFQGQRHEPPAVGRERARRRPPLVPLEHVQPRRRLQVVHHHRPFARPHREALGRAVEVDGWVAVGGGVRGKWGGGG